MFRDEVFLGDAIGCDLSEAGCAIKTPVPMMKDDYVAMELYLPDYWEQIAPLDIEVAVVRWAAEEKYGLEFIKLPHEDHQRLRRYLMSLQTTRPRSKAPIQVPSHRPDPKAA